MRNQQLSIVLQELHAVGVSPQVLRTKHIQIRWCGPHGEQRVCVLASTSRSATGIANARATVRRLLRQDGMLL